MSIFDYKPKMPNIKAKTMGGEVFWNDLVQKQGYRVQQNKTTGHCRILDINDERVAWGSEAQMYVIFRRLTGGISAWHAKKGDVIGVHRIKGAYDHYGVYESDNCIYEYAASEGDFKGKKANIHITTLEKFIGKSKNYFVLEFPKKYGYPAKLEMPVMSEKELRTTYGMASAMGMMSAGNTMNGLSGAVSGIIKGSAAFGTTIALPYPKSIISIGLGKKLIDQIAASQYTLYSPEETIKRAKTRLNEQHYDLVFNNCEHYAIWCKTGLKTSHQVRSILGF